MGNKGCYVVILFLHCVTRDFFFAEMKRHIYKLCSVRMGLNAHKEKNISTRLSLLGLPSLIRAGSFVVLESIVYHSLPLRIIPIHFSGWLRK